jgi:hypothetical protein
MFLVCPHCQAENQPGVTRCWMCGEALGDAEIVEADVVGSADERSGLSYVLTALMVVVTLITVAVGLWREAPGLSALLVVVGGPAVLITLVRLFRRRGRGEKITGGQTALDFLLSALVVGFVATSVASIAVVCFVIFFLVMCFRLLGGH